MIAWFARNAVAANMLMAAILLGGVLFALPRLPLEVFPPADPRTIAVQVALRGASPEDMELGVAVRVEEAIQDLEGIKRIRSISREGSASVFVDVDPDYNPRELLDEVKARVDTINTFPQDIERPSVSLAQRRFDVISVFVAGDHEESEIRDLADQVRNELMALDSVTLAEINSARNYEIAIEVSQDRLRHYNLSLEEVAAAIRGSSLDVSAGNVRAATGDIFIRSKGQAYRQDDFEAIVVKTNRDGSIIRLSDLARVQDSFSEDRVQVLLDNRPAVFINVYRTGNQSAIEVAREVRAYVERRQPNMPRGVSLGYWDDDSKILVSRLSIMASGLVQGGILVILLLSLFLRPTVAFWTFMGIPVSVCGAFITLWAIDRWLFDISLNIMSAFGFIIVIGILVDDAIVTGENIFRKFRRGETGLDAVIDGTREVAVPVTFGVLTTMVAFFPLLMLDGWLSRFFPPIAVVVIATLFFSLVESKLVLPSHLRNLDLNRQPPRPLRALSRWQRRFSEGFEVAVMRYYQPLLRRAMAHKTATIAAFVGVLLIIPTLFASGWVRVALFPNIDSETARVSLTMPIGTSFDVTEAQVRRITDAALALQQKYQHEDQGRGLIGNVVSVAGGGGSHRGQVYFEVTPPEQRASTVSIRDITNEWRRSIGAVPGAESLTFRASIFRAGSPIDVELRGRSMERLAAAAEDIKAYLRDYDGVYEIEDSLSEGKDEVQVALRQQGHVMGLTRSDILRQIGQAFQGLEVQRVQRGRDDIRVLLRFPPEERTSLDKLNSMLIRAPDGTQAPLATFARLSYGRAPVEIERIDMQRTLNVRAEVEKDKVNMTLIYRELRERLQNLTARYPDLTWRLSGEAQEQRDIFSSLGSGALMALLIIYALLALPLKSYIQPLIIMLVIPFGLIGAALGHLIMGTGFVIMSLLGLMALAGVLVNDSLVLVDYINRRRRQGDDMDTAVMAAGVARMRPVLLTSLTTFLGLMPTMFLKSTSAQFVIPMAISLGYGILFTTLITLILVPINVIIAHRAKHRLLDLWRGQVAGRLGALAARRTQARADSP